ncbi:MAG TPA: hypothetical protein PLP26_05030, partial [Ilumatobacteraceae bacterium]|nr:hypothetical protein [Ilumatobacteraceae bacterium]
MAHDFSRKAVAEDSSETSLPSNGSTTLYLSAAHVPKTASAAIEQSIVFGCFGWPFRFGSVFNRWTTPLADPRRHSIGSAPHGPRACVATGSADCSRSGRRLCRDERLDERADGVGRGDDAAAARGGDPVCGAVIHDSLAQSIRRSVRRLDFGRIVRIPSLREPLPVCRYGDHAGGVEANPKPTVAHLDPDGIAVRVRGAGHHATTLNSPRCFAAPFQREEITGTPLPPMARIAKTRLLAFMTT